MDTLKSTDPGYAFMIMESCLSAPWWLQISKKYVTVQSEAAVDREMTLMLVLAMVMTMMWLNYLMAALAVQPQPSTSPPTHIHRAHSLWGVFLEKGGAEKHPSFSKVFQECAFIGLCRGLELLRFHPFHFFSPCGFLLVVQSITPAFTRCSPTSQGGEGAPSENSHGFPSGLAPVGRVNMPPRKVS